MQVAGISQYLQAASHNPAASGKTGETSFQDVLKTVRGGESSVHTVSPGDTLWSICRDRLAQFGGSPSPREIAEAIAKVASSNALGNPNLIRPGQQLDLSVLGGSPTAPTLKAEPLPAGTPIPVAVTAAPSVAAETFASVPAPSYAALASLQPGVSLIGLNDALPVVQHNPFLPKAEPAVDPAAALLGVGPLAVGGEGSGIIPAKVAVEKVLSLMESLVTPHEKAEEPLGIDSPWSRVVNGAAHLTSEFGIRRDPLTRRWVQHDGLDLAAAQGTQIKPLRDGEVTFSGWQPGYGKVVIVRHDDGLESVYGHASKVLVQTGQRVSADTPLAEVGSTGRSTGPHLHFEVRKDGRAVDPVPFLATTSFDVAQAL